MIGERIGHKQFQFVDSGRGMSGQIELIRRKAANANRPIIEGCLDSSPDALENQSN